MDQAHVKLTFNFSPLNAKFWLRQGSELYSRTWPFALGIKQNSFERNNSQAKSQTFLRPAYVLSPSAWTMEDVFAHMFVFVRHRLEWKRSFRTLLKQFSKINLNSWRTYHVRYLFLAYSSVSWRKLWKSERIRLNFKACGTVSVTTKMRQLRRTARQSLSVHRLADLRSYVMRKLKLNRRNKQSFKHLLVAACW